MELDKKEKEILEAAISEWESQEVLTTEKANELRKTISLKKVHGQVAQYFFIIAIACTLLAFGAIFIDDKLLEKIRRYFDVGNLIIAIACTLIAIAWFVYLSRKRKSINSLVYEVYMVLGGLVVVSGLVYYCKDIGFGPQYTGLLAATAIIVLSVGAFFKSRALWLAGILAVMGLYGSYSEWRQNESNLFLGMNYPMRFTIFGVLVIGLAFLQNIIRPLRFSQRQTYVMGLLIFFTGLWGLSIFGNYGRWEEWEQVRQVQVVGYAIVLAIISIAALILGIRYNDDVTRDFGIIFILLNLYSRYFEYFWNTTNKGIFFMILAASFALVGWQLEKRMKRAKQ
ncbi:MAG: DUF2157 domain-containing protein [Taibaiella sp.]|nr:DUF2157 domain-containing protein [Taibaiella sp.]